MTRLFRHCATVTAVALATMIAGATPAGDGGVLHPSVVPNDGEGACVAVEYSHACEVATASEAVHAPRASQTATEDGGECGQIPGVLSANMRAVNVEEYRRTVSSRPEDLVERIHAAGKRLGVAPHIGEGIVWTESRFDPTARSADGLSVGAFQLTQVTAEEMRRRLAGSTMGLSLNDEVTLGLGYLRYLSRLFARPVVLDDAGNTTTAVSDCPERWRFAIAAYNAGEGRVAEAQRRAQQAGLDPTRFEDIRPYLPRITRRYVDSVLTFAAFQMAGASLQAS